MGEIRNSVQYFASLPGRAPISKVLVTGGASRLQGSVEALQSQMRIPVQVQSPLARLNLSKLDRATRAGFRHRPGRGHASRPALPEPNPSVQKFNLIPPEVVLRAKQRRVQTIAFAVAGLVLLLVIGASVGRYLQVHSAQNNVTTLKAQQTTLNAEIPKFSHAVQAQQEAQKAQAEIGGINAASVDWAKVFASMQSTVPDKLVVSAFCGSAVTATGATAPGGARVRLGVVLQQASTPPA